MPGRKLLTVLFAAAAIASGCGSNDQGDQSAKKQKIPGGGGPKAVAASDVEATLDARRQISAACSGQAPRSEIRPAVRVIADITRQEPNGRFESGQTDTPQNMSSVARAIAKELDRCAPDEARKLRSVATGKQPTQGTPNAY